MAKVHKYRLRCTTDDVYEYVWAEDGAPAPTLCPTDTAHTVDQAQTAIVQTTGPNEVQIAPRMGQQDSLADGVSIQANSNSQAHGTYSMPEGLHLDELVVLWKDFENGDRGWLALVHPSSEGNPAADPSGSSVDVGPALAPYYNPAAGAMAVEFWNTAGTEIEEVIPIASISGNVVTLASAIQGTYTTANAIKARFQSFSPIRGTMGLDGGFRFLGEGSQLIGATNEQTSIIPAGMKLFIYLVVSSGGLQRHFATNFIFRKPEG